MKAYLIECGHQHIIFFEKNNRYCMLDAKNWQLFNKPNVDFDQFDANHQFSYVVGKTEFTDHRDDPAKPLKLGETISETELLAHFYDPQHNSGAIIATRDDHQAAPNILDKKRFDALASIVNSP